MPTWARSTRRSSCSLNVAASTGVPLEQSAPGRRPASWAATPPTARGSATERVALETTHASKSSKASSAAHHLAFLLKAKSASIASQQMPLGAVGLAFSASQEDAAPNAPPQRVADQHSWNVFRPRMATSASPRTASATKSTPVIPARHAFRMKGRARWSA